MKFGFHSAMGAVSLAIWLAAGTAGATDPAGVPAGERGTVQRPRTISVVGEGEATGTPDVARTSLGVEARSPRAGAAVADANARMTAVVSALKKTGIGTRDIRTTDFSVNFERPRSNRRKPGSTGFATSSRSRSEIATGSATCSTPRCRPARTMFSVSRFRSRIRARSARKPARRPPRMRERGRRSWPAPAALRSGRFSRSRKRERLRPDPAR